MNDKEIKAFNAIRTFVQDLDTYFQRKYRSVALYNRLTSKITDDDNACIQRHLDAFKAFYSINSEYLMGKPITQTAIIKYSENVYLDMFKILNKMDASSAKQIYKHLVTIYSLINIGTADSNSALEKLVATSSNPLDALNFPSTNEGNFIKSSLEQLTNHIDLENCDNPMAAVTNIMQSGFFTQFMGDLQSKFENGELDIGSLTNLATQMVTEQTQGEDTSQIKEMINTSITQMSAFTGGQLPPQVQQLVDSVLDPNTQSTSNPQPTSSIQEE